MHRMAATPYLYCLAVALTMLLPAFYGVYFYDTIMQQPERCRLSYWQPIMSLVCTAVF